LTTFEVAAPLTSPAKFAITIVAVVPDVVSDSGATKFKVDAELVVPPDDWTAIEDDAPDPAGPCGPSGPVGPVGPWRPTLPDSEIFQLDLVPDPPETSIVTIRLVPEYEVQRPSS
jgi:hypothetical protein